LLSSYVKADNYIELKNVESDALNLTIEQVGAKNTIQCYQDNWCYIKDSVTIDLKQVNTSTSTNTIEIWHIEDGNNTIRWGQGVSLNNKNSTTWLYDADEGGGHYARIDVHGGGNTFVGYQQNGGDTVGHIFTSLIFSDNNDIWVRQKNNGQKELNLYTTSDGNDIDIIQRTNGGEHTANINLHGSYPTTLSLIQQGQTDQSYSLTQTCQTIGGCSISVTQGN
tara:strand:+ start:4638 stop:5306 length:669 start_codon:yes stop_codon:yes gene_type:complete